VGAANVSMGIGGVVGVVANTAYCGHGRSLVKGEGEIKSRDNL
jgi:uncharacterized Fe-S cluster protein YjdI